MRTYKEKYFKWENIPDNINIIITPNGYGKKYYKLQKKYNKQKVILNKIKEYCNNRLEYYNEMKRDYDIQEFDGYAENDNENILELLEKIK